MNKQANKQEQNTTTTTATTTRLTQKLQNRIFLWLVSKQLRQTLLKHDFDVILHRLVSFCSMPSKCCCHIIQKGCCVLNAAALPGVYIYAERYHTHLPAALHLQQCAGKGGAALPCVYV